MTSEDELPLELPGWWIDHPDRDWAFLTQMLLDGVLDQLNEAALVLSLYRTAGDPTSQPPPGANRLPHLYARCFVYALDAVGQLIRVLLRYDQLPLSARTHCERYLSEFGALRDLRNSLQHIEDRLRGLGPHRAPLPKPLVVLGAFRNNHFGGTTADGTYVEVEMSSSPLLHARAIVEDLLWSFAWLGPGNTPVDRPTAASGRHEMSKEFLVGDEHRRWARNAQRKYGGTMRYWLELISKQRGCCAFSGVRLRFDPASGTPKAGGPGAHPLYAAVDHTAPGSDELGHEIVSYDLNDLKGHLPPDCFAELRAARPWKRLMRAWRDQATNDPNDRAAFRRIRRSDKTAEAG